MKSQIDLHVHSNKSDGTFTPKELVDYAQLKGLCAFALTDHDTVEGLHEAKEYVMNRSLEVISGIELSSNYHGQDIHILGLYINDTDPNFLKYLQEVQLTRQARNDAMIHLLQKQGFAVTMDTLRKYYGNAILTRLHFAKFLYEQGYVVSTEVALKKYFMKDCPCYVPRKMNTPESAVELVRMAKGIPILAHPLLYHLEKDKLEALVSRLKEVGLMGIESIYSMNTIADDIYLAKLVKEHGLLRSGGSDFHGSAKPSIDMGSGRGKLYLPYEILEQLKQHLREG